MTVTLTLTAESTNLLDVHVMVLLSDPMVWVSGHSARDLCILKSLSEVVEQLPHKSYLCYNILNAYIYYYTDVRY
jgi:hypothetical protein